MSTDQVHFDDGAAYERYMGRWSQLAGMQFLDWLAPSPGLQWLDIGCGNGAFTELLVARCAPAGIQGVDPSAPQIEYARTRPALQGAMFQVGDAMALPQADASVDVAVMPLVIFFVPEPARGVAEMKRVLRAGGIGAAYAWDMEGGGFPYALLHEEMRNLEMTIPQAPSPSASQLGILRKLWTDAGFTDIETRTIAVERVYENFEDYWDTVQGGPSVGRKLAALSDGERVLLRERLQVRLPAGAGGRITVMARANAIRARA